MREHVERFWAYALDSALAPGLLANYVYGVPWVIKPTNSLARIGRFPKFQRPTKAPGIRDEAQSQRGGQLCAASGCDPPPIMMGAFMMEAFSRYLMGAVLAVLLMWASTARALEEVKCMPGIFAVPSYCPALIVEADVMREALAEGPTYTIPIMTRCIRGLNASIPGHDYNTYFNTCSQILQSMATVH